MILSKVRTGCRPELVPRRIRNNEDALTVDTVVPRQLRFGEFADGQNGATLAEEEPRCGPIEESKRPRVTFRLAYIANVMMGYDLVSVGHRSGVAQVDEQTTVPAYLHREIHLLPRVSTADSD